MVSKKKDKNQQLLGLLSQPVARPESIKEQETTVMAAVSPGTVEKPSGGKSEKVMISLYPEDQDRIRELLAWFASQGKTINTSLAIKSALRAARTGSELLDAYEQARSLDQRRKKRAKASGT